MANQNQGEMVARMAKAKQEALNALTDAQNESLTSAAVTIANMGERQRRTLLVAMRERLLSDYTETTLRLLNLTVSGERNRDKEAGQVTLWADKIRAASDDLDHVEKRCDEFVALLELVIAEAARYGFATKYENDFDDWGMNGLPGCQMLDADDLQDEEGA